MSREILTPLQLTLVCFFNPFRGQAAVEMGSLNYRYLRIFLKKLMWGWEHKAPILTKGSFRAIVTPHSNSIKRFPGVQCVKFLGGKLHSMLS
jgi:hypothetical protein